MPLVRFSDPSEFPVDRGICFCRSSHARPIQSPILCWSAWRQFHWCSLHRSSHTLGLKQERRLGGWDDRWSSSCGEAKGWHEESPGWGSAGLVTEPSRREVSLLYGTFRSSWHRDRRGLALCPWGPGKRESFRRDRGDRLCQTRPSGACAHLVQTWQSWSRCSSWEKTSDASAFSEPNYTCALRSCLW